MKTFMELTRRAGLVDRLNNVTNATIFAPTDDAFRGQYKPGAGRGGGGRPSLNAAFVCLLFVCVLFCYCLLCLLVRSFVMLACSFVLVEGLYVFLFLFSFSCFFFGGGRRGEGDVHACMSV